jgi:hypothetical protein
MAQLDTRDGPPPKCFALGVLGTRLERQSNVKTIRSSVLLMVISLLGGCGTDTLLAEDYETSCAKDDECVSVLVGDMCECACSFGAIRASEQSRYDTDRADISCSTDCGPCPAAPPAACVEGRCAVAE